MLNERIIKETNTDEYFPFALYGEVSGFGLNGSDPSSNFIFQLILKDLQSNGVSSVAVITPIEAKVRFGNLCSYRAKIIIHFHKGGLIRKFVAKSWIKNRDKNFIKQIKELGV